MSWDQVWTLPRKDYTNQEVQLALKRVLEDFSGVERIVDEFDGVDPQNGEDSLELAFRIPELMVLDEGDEPEGEPDEEGFFECVLTIEDDEEGPWQIIVSSDEAQNRDANLTICALASRISVLLGGPEQPAPIV